MDRKRGLIKISLQRIKIFFKLREIPINDIQMTCLLNSILTTPIHLTISSEISAISLIFLALIRNMESVLRDF